MKLLKKYNLNLMKIAKSLLVIISELAIVAMLLQNNYLFYILIEDKNSFLQKLNLSNSLPAFVYLYVVFEIYLIFPMAVLFVLNTQFNWLEQKVFWKLQIITSLIIAVFTLALSTVNIAG